MGTRPSQSKAKGKTVTAKSKRPQGKLTSGNDESFPSKENLQAHWRNYSKTVQLRDKRRARALEILKKPGFSEDYFVAVVMARCMKLREACKTLPKSLQILGTRWAMLLEGAASHLALFDERHTKDKLKDEPETARMLQILSNKLEKASNILMGPVTPRPWWKVFDNMSMWAEAEVGDIAETLFKKYSKNDHQFDLGQFFVKFAQVVSCHEAGRKRQPLADLYRAWCKKKPTGSKKAAETRDLKWQAAANFISSRGWSVFKPATVRVEYSKLNRDRVPPCDLVEDADFRWNMWHHAVETLRRLEVKTNIKEWELAWQKRMGRTTAPKK